MRSTPSKIRAQARSEVIKNNDWKPLHSIHSSPSLLTVTRRKMEPERKGRILLPRFTGEHRTAAPRTTSTDPVSQPALALPTAPNPKVEPASKDQKPRQSPCFLAPHRDTVLLNCSSTKGLPGPGYYECDIHAAPWSIAAVAKSPTRHSPAFLAPGRQHTDSDLPPPPPSYHLPAGMHANSTSTTKAHSRSHDKLQRQGGFQRAVEDFSPAMHKADVEGTFEYRLRSSTKIPATNRALQLLRTPKHEQWFWSVESPPYVAPAYTHTIVGSLSLESSAFE